MFKNNLVYIPNNKENEFARAVCSTNEVLDNCKAVNRWLYKIKKEKKILFIKAFYAGCYKHPYTCHTNG